MAVLIRSRCGLLVRKLRSQRMILGFVSILIIGWGWMVLKVLEKSGNSILAYDLGLQMPKDCME